VDGHQRKTCSYVRYGILMLSLLKRYTFIYTNFHKNLTSLLYNKNGSNFEILDFIYFVLSFLCLRAVDKIHWWTWGCHLLVSWRSYLFPIIRGVDCPWHVNLVVKVLPCNLKRLCSNTLENSCEIDISSALINDNFPNFLFKTGGLGYNKTNPDIYLYMYICIVISPS
jgi:hypothetical protein